MRFVIAFVLATGCSSSEPSGTPTAADGATASSEDLCGFVVGSSCGPVRRTLGSCACNNPDIDQHSQLICCIDGKVSPLGCWDLFVGSYTCAAPDDAGPDASSDSNEVGPLDGELDSADGAADAG